MSLQSHIILLGTKINNTVLEPFVPHPLSIEILTGTSLSFNSCSEFGAGGRGLVYVEVYSSLTCARPCTLLITSVTLRRRACAVVPVRDIIYFYPLRYKS